MATCYLNGKYLPLSKAKISVTDRGFQFSDGVYEVIASYDGTLIDIDLHLKRLKKSLKEIDIKINLSIEEILKISKEIQSKDNLKTGIIYIQVTRGNQNPRDHKYTNNLKANIIIYSIQKDLKANDQLSKKGVPVITYPDIRWLRADIKSISLLGNVMAVNKAKDMKCHEAILIDQNSNVTEGNSSSIWIIKGNKCITHPLTNKILNGVTRKKLISIIKKNNLIFEEKIFKKELLFKANEVFMTNATNFIMPIIKVDKIKIGKGLPGVISLLLRKQYLQAIK
ncbi:aminotransferase class IV [Alphaproteobacteria bacterium]|nr:aminotransferase class IV [Alphaproteobacteria bacterium]MDB4234458.1 aminotransferase class IV [Alphaproteobacteria bacterium]MDB9824954.1 aminotransferase class IV [Alphaproteobacteria bacterium]